MKILGYDYVLEYGADADSMGAWGRCHPKTQIIQVANDLTEQHAQSTMLHEIIEALDYHLQLGFEHKSKMSLESGLYQVLSDAGVDLSPLIKGFS